VGKIAVIFLIFAAMCGLSAFPALLLYLYIKFPDTLWAEVVNIQTLVGASIALFAASLGTIGVLLTLWNQRRNLDKQLAAQRDEQDRSRAIERRHVASAFIGEISVIIEELESEPVGPILKKTLRDLETKQGKIQFTTVRGSGSPAYYNSEPGNVGLFPGDIPEEMTRFYNRIGQIHSDLERYSNAAEHFAEKGNLPVTITQELVLYYIRRSVSNINLCVERGKTLIRKPKKIKDIDFIPQIGSRVLGLWPLDYWWYPGTLTNICGERFWVRYDDENDDRLLAAEDIIPLTHNVNDRVECRWRGSTDYYPAMIVGIEGDIITVRYERGPTAGEEERTKIGLLRVR
jgi:hypothetical protein